MTPSLQHPDRRRMLAGLGAAAGGLVLPAGSLVLPAQSAQVATPLVLEAKPLGGGMAYDGAVPGPLVRVTRGEPVVVRLVNRLTEPTTLTWHGVRIVNAMDGVAGLTQPAVPPGGTFDVAFTPPDAGTYWYHPHASPDTAAQTAAGLRGVLIVDEPSPPPVDADLLLFLADGPNDTVTIKGKPGPMAPTLRPGARLRLRLVNACVSRIAFVAIAGAVPSVIAIDGQPSELFQPPSATVPIGPGARFELMLDAPATAGAPLAAVLRGTGGAADRPLMEATIAGAPVAQKPPIAKLPENPLLPARIALEKASRHEVAIVPAPNGRWTIGGVPGMPAKPLFSVRRGTPVVLAIRNGSDLAHAMHVHGHCWRLLHDLDDGWDPFWRDSVLLAPGKAKHVAFVADNPGRWALASADLRRQVEGLSTWFEVR